MVLMAERGVTGRRSPESWQEDKDIGKAGFLAFVMYIKEQNVLETEKYFM